MTKDRRRMGKKGSYRCRFCARENFGLVLRFTEPLLVFLVCISWKWLSRKEIPFSGILRTV